MRGGYHKSFFNSHRLDGDSQENLIRVHEPSTPFDPVNMVIVKPGKKSGVSVIWEKIIARYVKEVKGLKDGGEDGGY